MIYHDNSYEMRSLDAEVPMITKRNYSICAKIILRIVAFISYSPYSGIILATMSSLFFSICSALVKNLDTISPFELALFRFIGILLPSGTMVIWSGCDDIFPSGKRAMLIFRSIMGASGLMLSFYAFRHMPLADASVIIFSAPVFVAIFARIFLKEPCGRLNIVAIIFTIIGVILITKPSFLFNETSLITKRSLSDAQNNYNIWNILAALGSTLCGASAYVLLRALKSLHLPVVMANFGFFASLQTLVVSWLLDELNFPKYYSERIQIIAIALFSFAGQMLLTLALKLENAGPVSIARSSDIVFAFIIQMFMFHDIPDGSTFLGALYVITSVIGIGFRKWILTLSDDDPHKKRFYFLTK